MKKYASYGIYRRRERADAYQDNEAFYEKRVNNSMGYTFKMNRSHIPGVLMQAS